MAYLAIQGCTLQILAPSTGSVTVTSQPASDVFGSEKGAYFGQLQFSVSGVSTTGATNGAGSGAISGTGSHMQNNNQPAVLQGDKVTITVNGQTTSSPPSPTSWPITVQITNAGQSYIDVS